MDKYLKTPLYHGTDDFIGCMSKEEREDMKKKCFLMIELLSKIYDVNGFVKVYSGEKWTQDAPINYYYKVRKGRHFHPKTERLIVHLLKIIRDKGLDEFHKMAKCQPPYSYLCVDYEGLYVP